MIPAFSLERTQDLLFEINNLVEKGRIPPVPIFLDSPLAIKVTKIYKDSEAFFNKETRSQIKGGDNIFNFPGLKMTLATEESKNIHLTPNPKIIIAGSGMSNGGRIVHHERMYLPDPKSTLLLVGYQAVGTPGRMLQEGAKRVRILGTEVAVNAKVVSVFGYSSHKDADHLFYFVEDMAERVKKVFAVMGEPKSSLFLVQRLRDYLGLDASAPERNKCVELEF
jgi:metallo-beta-lactamase family protein